MHARAGAGQDPRCGGGAVPGVRARQASTRLPEIRTDGGQRDERLPALDRGRLVRLRFGDHHRVSPWLPNRDATLLDLRNGCDVRCARGDGGVLVTAVLRGSMNARSDRLADAEHLVGDRLVAAPTGHRLRGDGQWSWSRTPSALWVRRSHRCPRSRSAEFARSGGRASASAMPALRRPEWLPLDGSRRTVVQSTEEASDVAHRSRSDPSNVAARGPSRRRADADQRPVRRLHNERPRQRLSEGAATTTFSDHTSARYLRSKTVRTPRAASPLLPPSR